MLSGNNPWRTEYTKTWRRLRILEDMEGTKSEEKGMRGEITKLTEVAGDIRKDRKKIRGKWQKKRIRRHKKFSLWNTTIDRFRGRTVSYHSQDRTAREETIYRSREDRN